MLCAYLTLTVILDIHLYGSHLWTVSHCRYSLGKPIVRLKSNYYHLIKSN